LAAVTFRGHLGFTIALSNFVTDRVKSQRKGKYMTKKLYRVMLFVGTSMIHHSAAGVFILCNIWYLLIYSSESNRNSK